MKKATEEFRKAKNKFCKFQNDYGYLIEHYKELSASLGNLIKEGKLKEYILKKPTSEDRKRKRLQTESPSSNDSEHKKGSW